MANMNVTYHDLSDAAGKLQGFESQITDNLHQAQALIQNLVATGFVTDHASKAFDQAYSDFTKGASQMIQGMGEMGKYLNNAASTLQDTDARLAQGLGGGH